MTSERLIMVPDWLVEEAASLIEQAGLSGTGVSLAAPRLRAALAQPAAGGLAPYVVGNQYRTQAGDLVRFVAVHNEGKSYETMEDESGVNRYTRRDSGRVTGTAHDYSDPRNTPPLWTAPPAAFSVGASESAATRLVLPTPEQVMHVVMRFQWEDRKNGTGTTNWAANLGMAVVEYVARLNKVPPAAAHGDEAVRKDAERYWWLCEQLGVTILPCAIERVMGRDMYIADGKPSIDAAIDVAMRAQAGEGGEV